MTREDKYPDTCVFHYHNANPRNRITGDCLYRAISTACQVPYNQVVMDAAELICTTGYSMTTDQGIPRLMEKYGWVKHKAPRNPDNTRMTGREFCLEIQRSNKKENSRIFCTCGTHHVTCIIDGVLNDIWDCTDDKIGNYWTPLGDS